MLRLILFEAFGTGHKEEYSINVPVPILLCAPGLSCAECSSPGPYLFLIYLKDQAKILESQNNSLRLYLGYATFLK